MSYFSDASLVYIPAAVRNGKTYSIKPTDGTGDLTFTRASSATRVGPNGYIEKVRENLALYSEDWTNWSLFQATATANTTANPLDGAVNADTLTISATNTTGVSYRSAATGTGIATFSAYLKAGTHDQAQIGFTDGTDFAVNVDLTLGTITGVTSGITGTITSVGSGWYRVTGTRTIANTTIPNVFVNVIVGTGGDSVIVFGAQAELGDIATQYIATTTAAVSVGPVSGTPRLDYLGSDCGRLLLEPQRSNLLTFSEQLNNAAWTQAFLTSSVTANAATSPDGYTNADRISDTTALNAEFGRGQVFTSTANVPHTISVFLKAGTNNFATLRFYGNNINNYFTAIVDLSAGTITKTQAGTGASGTSATITNYGNGWYRVTATATINTNTYYNIVQLANSGTQTIGDFGNVFYSGSGTGNILAYGAMAELGAYATSLIPTLGTAVTRVAERASKVSISALIGGTSGTIFFKIKTNKTLTGDPYKQFFYYENAAAAQAYMYIASNNLVVTNPSLGNISSSFALQPDTTYKVAIAYATNDFKLYINGTDAGTSTSGTPIDALSLTSIGSYAGSSEFNEMVFEQYLHFKTRLTNAQLAELTTL